MKKNRLCDRETRWRWRKMLMIMKLFVLLTCCFTFTLSANTLAQRERVNVNLKDVSVQKLFDAIQQQTKLYFLFNLEQVQRLGKVSVDASDETVESVLDNVFKDSGLTYQFSGNMIIVRLTTTDDPPKSVTVKGWVYDVNKKPMPGVTIKVAGTTVGTATNGNGWFALQLPMLKGTLEFSFVGFKKQQVDYTEKTDTLRIVMQEDVSDLDEVTVIAYGERRKREVVSAISSVKGEEIKEIPTASFTSLLQGRMAGVQITNQSGSPGGGGTIVAVRGYNSLMFTSDKSSDGQPLYVIDGVPMHSFTSPVTGTNALAELDPSTIESVEVLKDAAAAALYGSRAGNGVILITTKKGKVGKASFSANVSYSGSIMPEFPYQMGGRGEREWRVKFFRNQVKGKYDFMTQTIYYPTSYEDAYKKGGQYDAFWNAGKPQGTNFMLQDSLNPFYNNQTNWWKKTFRTGKVVNANVQASGGTPGIRYMVGMGYYTERGIMFGSDFKRANFLANLSMKPAKRINFDTRLYLAYTDKSRNTKDNAFASAGKIESLTADPKKTSTLLLAGGEVEKEILGVLNGVISRDDSYRLMFNANLGIDIIKGLQFTSSMGLDYSQNNSNVFEPSYLDSRGENKSTGLIERVIGITQENLLKYTRNINDVHRLELLAGLTYTENQNHSVKGSGRRGASDDVHYVSGSGTDIYDYGSGQVESLLKYMSSYTRQVMVSYLGRIAYNYKLKYLMEFTYRRDGSSAFGEDVRYANFPAVAVGWSFSEESFVKNLMPWLGHGKVRASWGTSGQTLNDPYLAHGLVNEGGNFMGNPGTKAPIINRDLSWEKSDQYDFGLDLDVCDYRLKFKLDYYYKYTKALLFNVKLPGDVLGNSSQWRNAMEVSNEGIELEVVGDIIRQERLSWRTRFNISRNWNRFEKSYSGQDEGTYVIGRPLRALFLYHDMGVVQNQSEVPQYSKPNGMVSYLQDYLPGMRMIRDINGDGTITPADQYYAGTTLPMASGGWVHELKWRNFDLNVLFSFTLGRKMINMYARNSLYIGQPLLVNYRNQTFWEKEGDNTDLGRVSFDDMELVDSRLERVNYLRLNTLSLGYNVPERVLGKTGLSGVRLFFTGENLFLWTNYSGVDPEVVSLSTGKDSFENYPLSRKFTLGLTVNF